MLIHVCVTCRRADDDADAPRPGARLHRALADGLPAGMVLRPVECLGNCKRSCTVALSAPNDGDAEETTSATAARMPGNDRV